jgi:AcrR family transcriptional regulator
VPKIVDEAAQRERIRDAARRVFSEHGIQRTGLARVAAAAGMGRSNLYHYYPDKAALVRDLAESLLAQEEALFREALAGDGPAHERILGLVRSVALLFEPRVGFGRLLLEIWISDAPRVRRSLRRVRTSLAELIRIGQTDGEIDPALDPAATAVLLVGLIDGLMIQLFLDPKGLGDPGVLRRAFLTAVRSLLGRTGPEV